MAKTLGVFVIAVVMGLNVAWGQAARSYLPVDFRPPQFLVFSAIGPLITVDAPAGLTPSFRPVGSSDGTAIYGEDPPAPGLIKVEFRPSRKSVVSGSEGLSRIFNLTLSRPPGNLFVSAQRKIDGEPQCGDFEIDPSLGTLRPLRIGRYPDCGGSVSPEGTRELHSTGERLSILDLRSGATIPLARGPASAVWSPDGKWIAAAIGEEGRIMIIDAADPTRRRKLGKEDGPLVWSPDSRYLLQLRSQFSCTPTVFGESLEIIDTFTGERSLVRSSHCQIIRGSIAWLDNGPLP
jgi:WD40 repeat protein